MSVYPDTTSKPESSLMRREMENLKYAALTAALGFAALVGSLSMHNHNRQVEALQAGLSVGGIALIAFGTSQGLEAQRRSDELEESDSGTK